VAVAGQGAFPMPWLERATDEDLATVLDVLEQFNNSSK